MKITFIQAPNSQLISRIPLGQLSIGSYLNSKSNHEVAIVDIASYFRNGTLKVSPSIYDDCSEFIFENFKSDVYAFSAVVTNEIPSLQIARRLKSRDFSCKICFGNQWASLNDIDVIKSFDFIDVIIRGEGEVTTLQLLETWANKESLENVLGITYRIGDKIYRNFDRPLLSCLDEIPPYNYSLLHPSFHEYSHSEYGGYYGTLEFGRGCPYNCSFCSTSAFWGRCARCFSLDRTISDIVKLKEMGADFVELTYDNFGTDPKTVLDFCNRLIKDKINIKWSIRCRLDCLDAELIKRLKDANCVAVLVGVESGSQEVLDSIDKKINYTTIFKTIDLLVRAGIRVDASLVTGLPDELIKYSQQTLWLASVLKTYGKLVEPQIHYVAPLPGTRFTRESILRKQLKFSSNPNISPDFCQYISWPSIYENTEKCTVQESRLEEDQKLIIQYPELFSAYGYIENPNVPSSYFASLSNYSNILIQFYPITLTVYIYMYSNRIFISDFEEFCASRQVSVEFLLSNKIRFESKKEIGYRKSSKVLLDLFKEFILFHATTNDLLYDVVTYESAICELSGDRNSILNSKKQNDSGFLTKSSIISPRCKVAKVNHNILDLIRYIQQSVLKSRNNLDFNAIEPSEVYYLFALSSSEIRYISSVSISGISRDVFSLFSNIDGIHTIEEVVQKTFPKINSTEIPNYIANLIDFLSKNPNLWLLNKVDKLIR